MEATRTRACIHFIAMIGYNSSIVKGYELTPTLLSLLVVAGSISTGFAIALRSQDWRVRWFAGGIIGAGVAAMLVEQRKEARFDRGERFVPRHLDELAVSLDHGSAQPVGIVVQMAERRTLRADVAAREHVVTVATDSFDALGAVVGGCERDLEAAPGLAQRTRANSDALTHVPRLERTRLWAGVRPLHPWVRRGRW